MEKTMQNRDESGSAPETFSLLAIILAMTMFGAGIFYERFASRAAANNAARASRFEPLMQRFSPRKMVLSVHSQGTWARRVKKLLARTPPASTIRVAGR